jgi:hypothetical protein
VNKSLPIHRRFRRTLLAAGAVSALALAGCGSDDAESDDTTAAAPADTTAEAPADTTASTTGESTAASGDSDDQTVCDNLIELDQTVPSGQATKEEANANLDEAIAAADEETATMLTSFQESLQPILDDPESEPSEEFFGQYTEMLGWVGENCDVDELDATAEEYTFSGLPEETAAGYYIVNFSNEGNEFHELLAVRINDDVTLPLEEILALPEEEADTMVEFLGAAFAAPGESTVASLNLAEPGRYAVVCFIPTGTTSMETEGSGPPHAMQGMTQEITVS